MNKGHLQRMAGALSDKEKEAFPSRGGDDVQPNTKHHNKCVKRLEYSMRRSARIALDELLYKYTCVCSCILQMHM